MIAWPVSPPSPGLYQVDTTLGYLPLTFEKDTIDVSKQPELLLAKGTALRSLNDIDIACYISGADALSEVSALLEYLAERLPGMATVEEPLALAQAIHRHSHADTLVVVDCLTLWLTNLLMPLQGASLDDIEWDRERDALCDAVSEASGPVLLVSNEIGLGVAPMSREARRFVDELGRLPQAMAARCDRVTLMVAGIEVPVKRGAR